jgi:signal transduction histidine kinase
MLGEAEVNAVEILASDLENSIAREPCLYDLSKGRALWRDRNRNLVPFDPRQKVAPVIATRLGLRKGLAIPLRSDTGEGMICLEEVRGLSTDHLDAAVQAGAAATAHIQRHRLFRTAEENAEARSRLILARDLHDSVVQFLAGAAFRLEAMKRSNASGRNVDIDLDELKKLMLQEQRELRSFITSLRSGPLTAFNDVAKDLKALAEHLSRQWSVGCEFSADPADLMLPTRTRLDAHQLMREAVANAVRHASAKSITIEAAAKGQEFRMEIINDGAEYQLRGGRLELPTSLKDRIEQAGGMLDIARGMGVTKLSITLPIGEANR